MMTPLRRIGLPRSGAVIIACLAVLISACGGDDDSQSPGASGPLTVEEALEVDDGERHDVEGVAVANDGVLRLCAALAESDPPQCGGPSLIVVGEATADLDALFGDDLQTKATTAWTDAFVVLSGVVADGELRLDG